MLSKPPREVWDHIALVMQVGLTFVGSVLFCLAIGYWLDRWLGIKGPFTVVFILLGIAGGGYTVYRQIMDMDPTKTDEDKKEPKNPPTSGNKPK
jgi:ATP synthase protein I